MRNLFRMVVALARYSLRAGTLAALVYSSFGVSYGAIDKNVSCSAVSATYVDLGTVAPGEKFVVDSSVSCKMLRRFSGGAGISFTDQYSTGAATGVSYLQRGTNMIVPRGGVSTASYTCVFGQCGDMRVGTNFLIKLTGQGAANNVPGTYWYMANFFITSLANTNYSEVYMSLLYTYKVALPASKVTSAAAMNLYFGNLSTDELSTAGQIANISLSCQSALTAKVTLVPAQSIINSGSGISATTLTGLSMIGSWADSGARVSLGVPRDVYLHSGSNSLNLKFEPRLTDAGNMPSGNFSSQYTLNIVYP